MEEAKDAWDQVRATNLSAPLSLASVVLGDRKAYEPDIRALLGTASQFCDVVVLKSMEAAKDAWD